MYLTPQNNKFLKKAHDFCINLEYQDKDNQINSFKSHSKSLIFFNWHSVGILDLEGGFQIQLH